MILTVNLIRLTMCNSLQRSIHRTESVIGVWGAAPCSRACGVNQQRPHTPPLDARPTHRPPVALLSRLDKQGCSTAAGSSTAAGQVHHLQHGKNGISRPRKGVHWCVGAPGHTLGRATGCSSQGELQGYRPGPYRPTRAPAHGLRGSMPWFPPSRAIRPSWLSFRGEALAAGGYAQHVPT